MLFIFNKNDIHGKACFNSFSFFFFFVWKILFSSFPSTSQDCHYFCLIVGFFSVDFLFHAFYAYLPICIFGTVFVPGCVYGVCASFILLAWLCGYYSYWNVFKWNKLHAADSFSERLTTSFGLSVQFSSIRCILVWLFVFVHSQSSIYMFVCQMVWLYILYCFRLSNRYNNSSRRSSRSSSSNSSKMLKHKYMLTTQSNRWLA